jgi:hypothetical protein
MRINSSGQVGIGTSNPAYKLQVEGAQNANDVASRNSTTGGVVRLSINDSFGQVGTIGSHPLGFATNDTLRMFINTSGDVGIGTTSPGVKLDVMTSGAPSIIRNTTYRGAAGQSAWSSQFARGTSSSPTIVQSGDSIGTFEFYPYNGTNFSLQTASISTLVTGTVTSSSIPTAIIFGTDAAGAAYSFERMRIDSSGNVLVGTTATAGSVSNSKRIVGGIFSSFTGSISNALTNTSYTMFDTGSTYACFIVSVIGIAADAPNYSATAVVNIQDTSVSISYMDTGGLIFITNSGTAIRVNQNAGGTMGTINWSAFRMA